MALGGTLGDTTLGDLTLALGAGGTVGPSPTATTTSRIGLGHVGLGSLVHVISSPYGTDFPPMVGNLWAIDTAPGGFDSAYGEVEAARAVKQPLVYTYGATWRIYHAETQTVIFAGRLTKPSFAGGKAQLNARGWGMLAARQANRLLYQSRFYADFAPAEGDPFNYSDDNQGIQASTNGGQIRFVIDKGSESDGDKARLAFWAPGNIITRVAGTLSGSGTDNKLIISTAVGPNGSPTQRRGPATVNVANGAFDVGNAGGDPGTTTWSGSLNTTDDMLLIGVQGVTPSGTTTIRVHVENLRINGIAIGDNWVTSDVVSDIAGRLGMAPLGVQTSTDLSMPWDQKDGTYAGVLDGMALISDWAWRTTDLGTGPVMEFAPWGNTRWRLIDPEMTRNFLPLEQFNQVVVPFTYNSSSATGLVSVMASPDPLAPFGIVNTYSDLVSSSPAVNSSTATQIASAAAQYLASERYGGTVTLSEVQDDSGGRQSAHMIRAGDGMYIPDFGVTLRIAEVRHEEGGVTLTFDEELATVTSMLARIQRRLQLTGLVGS